MNSLEDETIRKLGLSLTAKNLFPKEQMGTYSIQ